MTRAIVRGYPVDRHIGLRCGCPLLDCCHNEGMPSCGARGHHVDSGSPPSGYLYPWTQAGYEAEQRYWHRPDPERYEEGSLERLVTEAELEEWRRQAVTDALAPVAKDGTRDAGRRLQARTRGCHGSYGWQRSGNEKRQDLTPAPAICRQPIT